MSAPLTRRERQVIDHVRSYVLEHGEAPTLRVIATSIGLSAKSAATAHRIVNRLIAAGRMTRVNGAHRRIALVPETPVLTIELPPALFGQVQAIAAQAKVTPEAVVVEAVRCAYFAARRSLVVARNAVVKSGREVA